MLILHLCAIVIELRMASTKNGTVSWVMIKHQTGVFVDRHVCSWKNYPSIVISHNTAVSNVLFITS